MIKIANYYRTVGMILLIAVVVFPSAAYPQWTTVGSAGTVDDADFGIVVFSGPIVSVSGSVSVATLDMRYNIVEGAGLQASGSYRYYFWFRYRDNGAQAQVILRLQRHSFLLGTTTTLVTFDSNLLTQSNDFKDVYTWMCLEGFSFFNYAYYFEVALKKFGSAGNPALSCIQLHRNITCP